MTIAREIADQLSEAHQEVLEAFIVGDRQALGRLVAIQYTSGVPVAA